ncbi:MAG TPA: hypothetical protein VKT77_09690 [Chthonomonadaceae bacterium]|nr:hypothetical protein [Chthonomonadaceae bacterium]
MTTQGSGFSESVREWAQKTFLLGMIPAVCLFAYLTYGLFTGQLAGSLHTHEERLHAIQVVNQLSLYLNIALVVALISALFLFFESDSLGITLVILAGVLAYGIRFLLAFLNSGQTENGPAAVALFNELRLAAMIIGAPGVLLVLRNIISRIVDARNRDDLASITYGKDVAKQHERPQALIGAFAACWQLPFCRDGIRVKCPIFLARTKCWKQRVGCMCEENIILMAMGGTERDRGKDMTAEPVPSGGFVPIGDLLTQNAEKQRAGITTRIGPRGVRIPTNPHISDAAKRERCRNCVIYNEHQRQKYGFLSGPVTVAVPALVFWNYNNLLTIFGGLMSHVDALVAKISFSGHAANANEVTQSLSGNAVIETVLIVCMTLILMTWSQRLLEYVCFKIKI